jgi:ATP-dependent Lhr-like helicase
MKERWERIFGFGLQARLWEEEILPARLREYHARWLDTLIGEAGILWLGCGKEKIAFCFDQDAELFSAGEARSEESEVRGDVTELFPRGSARHGFWDLVDSSKLGSTALAERLWTLAWRGEVSADSFQPVRRGLENGFRAEQAASEGGKRRRGFDRWRTSRPSAGYWFRVDRDPKERDALDTEELNRDRIRQALVRYGVVFREILENELPLLRWPRLFRSLRLMEFSGEVVSGRFFDGVPGLQFASAAGLAALSADLPEDAVYWMNAVDPASLCGVAIDDLKTVLPARRATTQVVFHGSKVVLVSRRTGVDLEFRVPPAAPSIPAYLAFVRELTDRDVRPLPSVHVERINGQPVASSPYKGRLLEFGFVEDYRRLVFRARI